MGKDHRQSPKNYLMEKDRPEKKTDEFYNFEKLTKLEYGEVWGSQTHSRRRKLILQKYPHISKLLRPTKYYSIILALLIIPFGLAVCYHTKVLSFLFRMRHGQFSSLWHIGLVERSGTLCMSSFTTSRIGQGMKTLL